MIGLPCMGHGSGLVLTRRHPLRIYVTFSIPDIQRRRLRDKGPEAEAEAEAEAAKLDAEAKNDAEAKTDAEDGVWARPCGSKAGEASNARTHAPGFQEQRTAATGRKEDAPVGRQVRTRASDDVQTGI